MTSTRRPSPSPRPRGLSTSPVAVIGAGAWGTALAILLSQNGRAVRLWEFYPEYAKVLASTRENPKFLPGVAIPDTIAITSDLRTATENSSIAVLAVPAQVLRSVIHPLAAGPAKPAVVITASKGIEQGSLARMSEIVQQDLGAATLVCALSGPSHAEEVGRGIPTSVVAAAKDPEVAQLAQTLFMTDRFRVYTSEDIIGVELAGALKNIIAIAAGVADGLGLGDNSKAALLTRGLAEMTRMGEACQARAATFYGLSGMGDLVVTCTSQHSRNRRVGEELGRGRRLADILNEMEMVAEGVETTRSVRQLARKHGVEMPITEQVYRILFDNATPQEALQTLMQRPRKAER